MRNTLKEIGAFVKNDNTKLVAAVSEYNGIRFMDLREWFLDAESKEYHPTKRGITLRSDVFESLLAALMQSEDEIMELLSSKTGKESDGKNPF